MVTRTLPKELIFFLKKKKPSKSDLFAILQFKIYKQGKKNYKKMC